MCIDFLSFCFYILLRYIFWCFSTCFDTFAYFKTEVMSISSIHVFATPRGLKVEGHGCSEWVYHPLMWVGECKEQGYFGQNPLFLPHTKFKKSLFLPYFSIEILIEENKYTMTCFGLTYFFLVFRKSLFLPYFVPPPGWGGGGGYWPKYLPLSDINGQFLLLYKKWFLIKKK